jgi:hypothetical protein
VDQRTQRVFARLDRLSKVATPPVTAAVVVLPAVKEPGPLTTASVTWSVLSLMTTLP